MSAIATPCIRVCVINPVNRLCEGCRRTLAEIAGWQRMSEAERLAVMATLTERGTTRQSAATTSRRQGDGGPERDRPSEA